MVGTDETPEPTLDVLVTAVRGAGPPGKFDAFDAAGGTVIAAPRGHSARGGGGMTDAAAGTVKVAPDAGGAKGAAPALVEAAAGATGKATISVTGMTCTTCANTVERTVLAVRCGGGRAARARVCRVLMRIPTTAAGCGARESRAAGGAR